VNLRDISLRSRYYTTSCSNFKVLWSNALLNSDSIVTVHRLAKSELFALGFLRMLGDKTNVSKKFRVNCSFFGDICTVTQHHLKV
jgi:hypothetical protein